MGSVFGSAQRADGGLCSGSRIDNLQTPDDRFPPAQSSGVWEVDKAVVVCPDPEQWRRRSCRNNGI